MEGNVSGKSPSLSQQSKKRNCEIPSSRLRKRQRRNDSVTENVCVESLIPLLEFWLSSANLSKDRFLVQHMANDSDAWVPANIFLKFRKVISLGATLDDVVSALSRTDIDHIETDLGSQSNPRIRVRDGLLGLTKLIREALSTEDDRTIYVEPLPTVVDRKKLTDIFERFGNVTYVSIPAYPDGRSKRFAFVEYRRVEDAEKIIAASKRNSLAQTSFPGISVISRNEWRERKEQYKDEIKWRRVAARTEDAAEGNSTASNVDEGEALKECAESASVGNNGSDAAVAVGRCEESHDVDDKSTWEKGLLVKISGLSRAESKVSRRSLFQNLEEYGPLAYIDFTPKTHDICTARYVDASGARRAFQALKTSGGGKLFGTSVRAELLHGTEEEEYWKNIEDRREAKKSRSVRKVESRAARRVGPRKQQPRNLGRRN